MYVHWYKTRTIIVNRSVFSVAIMSLACGEHAVNMRWTCSEYAVGAASQWWSNERMMVYFKLMMVKCLSMMVKWYDHTLIWPSLTSIWPSLTSISPSLASSKPSLAHLTIIEKLHRLICGERKKERKKKTSYRSFKCSIWKLINISLFVQNNLIYAQ